MIGDNMKTQEVTLGGKKVNVVVDFDDSLLEEAYIIEEDDDNLEDTIDLTKTMELVLGELNE